MIKHILIDAVNDTWAQAGVAGAAILGLSKWIIVTFGSLVGDISTLAGLVVVCLVIVEKSIAIRAAYGKYRKAKQSEHAPPDGGDE